MRNAPIAPSHECQQTEALILDAIADGTVLIGTLVTLSQGLGVKVVDL